jgi:hypothetical protein
VKHRTVICMLNGAIWRGTVEAAVIDHAVPTAPGKMLGEYKQLYFESSDGALRELIDMDAVKAIYYGAEVESEAEAGPRFFDSAPIPSSLWVRTAFLDGEIVEGMIANEWSALNGALLELHVPSQELDRKQVLIPRTSIAELQVITTR